MFGNGETHVMLIDEIRNTYYKFIDRCFIRGDMDGLGEFLARDITVIGPEKNDVYIGLARTVEFFAQRIQYFVSLVRLQENYLRIFPYTSGSALLIAELEPLSEEEKQTFRNEGYRISVVWIYNDNLWQIKHIHFSSPISLSNSNGITQQNGQSEDPQLLQKLIHKRTREVCELNIGISKVNKELNELQKRFEAVKNATEHKNLFLANMSHEIRTPLTGIIGMSDILSRSQLTPEQDIHLKVIKDSSKALLGLINDIMDISRIEAGKLNLRCEPFNLKELLLSIKTMVNPIAINKNNQLNILLADGIPDVIKGDRYRMEQVLMNLINNAMKYTSNGRIDIRVNQPDPQNLNILNISVSDTGIGISPENISRLFQQFIKIENHSGNDETGTGLGLYICKELVNLMDGNIGVESQPGQGSTFWFTVKTVKPEDMPDIFPMQNEDDDPWDISLDLNVLLVEDKPVNVKVISLMLNTANCRVDTAVNGLEALDVIDVSKHQVVLMDIMMPVMDGITTMKEIRKKFTNPPPIIAITANAMQGDEEKYLGLGFDAYIAKPVTMRKLTSHLKNLGIINQLG